MQSVSSRIWTRAAVFISYDDNNYTTGTMIGYLILKFDSFVKIFNIPLQSYFNYTF